MDSMRYVVPIGAPHSKYRFPRTLMLGSEGQRPVVEHDDFVSKWAQPEQSKNFETSKSRLNEDYLFQAA